MIPEDERPPIVDQEIPPYGVWRGGNPMQWEPTEAGDFPRGPVLPQEHPEGTWFPGPGGFMSWEDAIPVEVTEPVIVIVPGDEDQDPPIEGELMG